MAKQHLTWTLQELRLLDTVRNPCWLSRPCVEDPLSTLLWANKVAIDRFGQIRPRSEQGEHLANADAEFIADRQRRITLSEQEVLGRGNSLHFVLNIKKALFITFDNVRDDEGFASIYTRPIWIRHDSGKEERLMLSQLEESMPADKARAVAMQHHGPNGAMLFDSNGVLLQANDRAARELRESGLPDAGVLLEDVLSGDSNGAPNTSRASEALDALFLRNQPSHRLTITSCGASGSRSHTLYAMFPAEDPVTREAALLLTSADVTPEKELELELNAVKEKLQRQNELLQHSNEALEAEKEAISQETAKLKAQQSMLQKRLQQALQMHLQPRTSVNTESPADKTLRLLDSLLQGNIPSIAQIVALQNDICCAGDLREPLNLREQLVHSSGLSSEVGHAIAEMLQGTNNTAATRLATIRGRQRHAEVIVAEDLLHLPELSGKGGARGAGMPAYHLTATTSGNMQHALRPHMLHAVIPRVERLLQVAESSWSFDSLELQEASGNMPLSSLGFYLIQRQGLIKDLNLVEDKLPEYLRAIEEGYNNTNPYHNRAHATAVLHMTHMLISHPGGLRDLGVVDNVTLLACYIAAISHDFGHPGLNNDFLIKTHNDLALTYNDISPLEMFHSAASAKVLRTHRFMENLPTQSKLAMRSTTIELILATDMKKHFNVLSQFQSTFKAPSRKSMSAIHTAPGLGTAEPAASEQRVVSTMSSAPPEHKLLALQCALKLADVGHLSTTQAVHKKWTSRLEAEFFAQGDEERKRNMTISPLMDRHNKTGVSKSQVGFFEIVALPLYKAYCECFPGAQPALEAVKANYAMWHADLQPHPGQPSSHPPCN
ncbi:hypothetical protein WJX84_009064 [Apatococcus fuscideae]|uniref:Phosphodiesterase n=1 Tax=Apatococcus fuscideae TaxID=2026836 RepID=A0AAW1THR8_9CHLO